MNSNDDSPFGIFRLGYTALVWFGVAVFGAILIWIVWTLFTHTSAGTAQSQRLEVVRPTQTALASLYSGGTAAVQIPPICTSCHIINGKGNQVCPNLTDIATIAQARIDDPSYTGSATTAEEYIRESILTPSAFCVPNDAGKVYCTSGTSIMPVGLDKQVSDLDALVTYLATPPEGE